MEDVMQDIRLSQIGYGRFIPARVVLLNDTKATLKDMKGNVIKTVCCEDTQVDAASGDQAAICDLGTLDEGEYLFAAVHDTEKISVNKDTYKEPLRKLLKGFYFQRCGCALDERFAGAWKHKACHTAQARLWNDPEKTMDAAGGWHDAGDYGRYSGPGAVAVAHMLYAYILFPSSFCVALDIPETGNGIPDVLNECRVELDWLLKMQRNDGAIYHKVSKKLFAPFIMPEKDLETEYVMPPSHCATAAACACFALAAFVWNVYDREYSARLEAAALGAWKWLEDNPDFVPFRNPEGVHTGEYGDNDVRDELFWASAELFALTGDEKFLSCAEKYEPEVSLYSFGWRDVSAFGALCLLTRAKDKLTADFYRKVLDRFVANAEHIAAQCSKSGYGTSLHENAYIWGSNMTVLTNAMLLIAAFLICGNSSFAVCAFDQVAYLYGMNALDVCFVTGMTERSYKNPHHRPSASDGVDRPVPGLVSGGPNNRFCFPSTREKLAQEIPPAKYWLDETPSADTNEIAIYWNSPAVFAVSFMDAVSRGDIRV